MRERRPGKKEQTMRLQGWPVAALLGVLLAGCAGVKGTVPPNLVGTAWLVEDLEGRGVIDNLQSTLEFPEEGRAAGNLGCNRFTTSVTQSGPLLSFGMPAATRRMCPPAIMDQEDRYSGVLLKTRGSLLDGDMLYLLDERGAKLARLVREEK
jgi:heat shock protein HslJ